MADNVVNVGAVPSAASRQAHHTSHAFEGNRARDLLTRGFRVARITYRQIQAEQPALAAQLDALLRTEAA